MRWLHLDGVFPAQRDQSYLRARSGLGFISLREPCVVWMAHLRCPVNHSRSPDVAEKRNSGLSLGEEESPMREGEAIAAFMATVAPVRRRSVAGRSEAPRKRLQGTWRDASKRCFSDIHGGCCWQRRSQRTSRPQRRRSCVWTERGSRRCGYAKSLRVARIHFPGGRRGCRAGPPALEADEPDVATDSCSVLPYQRLRARCYRGRVGNVQNWRTWRRISS